jgi:hypothetical protein
MDGIAESAPWDLEIINELLSRVTHGFDSANIHQGLRNHQQNGFYG